MSRDEFFFGMGMGAALLCAITGDVVEGVVLSGILAAIFTAAMYAVAQWAWGKRHAKSQCRAH